jgi:hypothetical protein
MFGHHFHSLVFVGTQSDALPIRKHEPLMGANFLDYVLSHFGAQPAENLRGVSDKRAVNCVEMIATIKPRCLIEAAR